jgi:hypothetical protein
LKQQAAGWKHEASTRSRTPATAGKLAQPCGRFSSLAASQRRHSSIPARGCRH